MLLAEFCEEFTREMNWLRMEGRASIDAAEAEIKRIDRELDKLMKLILTSGSDDAPTRIMKQMKDLEARQIELKGFLRTPRSRRPSCMPTWRITITSRLTSCMWRFKRIQMRSECSLPT